MTVGQDDVDRLMTVMAGAFDPYWREAWTRRQVEDALVLGNCHYSLINPAADPAGPDDAAVGFWFSRGGYEEEELLLLAVLPEHRGKGLGSSLIAQLAQSARARGAKRLLLEMRDGNPAESLYRAAGFEQIGRRPRYYSTIDGTSIDAKTFAKAL